MSISRLALRLAAVEALCPSSLAESGPYPTWAGSEVYDSKITPLADADGWREFIAQVQGKPIITVYTEEQETAPIEGARYPAEIEVSDLIIEILIAATAIVEVEGPDGKPLDVGSIEAPITSPQHEAMLDMIEQQVRNLLDPFSQASPLPYSWVAYELHHVKSVPMRDAEDRLSRQAARTVTFKVKVRHASAYGKPQAGIPDDIAGLPEPLLTVARALVPESPGGQLVRQIAKGQPPAPVLRPLDDIRIISNLGRGVAPTAPKNADMISDVKL